VPSDHSDDRRGFLTILENVLTVGGWLGAKSELIGLSINQEASQKKLQGARKTARRRTSPRRSGGSMSTLKNTLTLPGPVLKKHKNLHTFIYNGFIFIDVFRELSKHTPHIYLWISTIKLLQYNTLLKLCGPLHFE
jgi:hypothetical protein